MRPCFGLMNIAKVYTTAKKSTASDCVLSAAEESLPFINLKQMLEGTSVVKQ